MYTRKGIDRSFNFAQNLNQSNWKRRKNSREIFLPKYESKFEQMPEIPKEAIHKLLITIDKDFDGKISVKELKDFIKSLDIVTIDPDIADEMYKDIVSRRNPTKKSKINDHISFDELINACNFLNKI